MSRRIMSRIAVRSLPSRDPDPVSPPAHWVGSPPTHFTNPWPSYKKHGFSDVISARFGSNRNHIPVPESRDELVKVRRPDWGRGQFGWETKMKSCWLGHAGFLVEMPVNKEGNEEKRGLRILFDAVFSERTSPLIWLGPKRYTPTPCTVDELPEIDLVVISHNHYDHLDFATIKAVYERQKRAGQDLHFFAGLNNKAWFLNAGLGIQEDEVTEMDWWEEKEVTVSGIGSIKLACTPAQHVSRRSPRDGAVALWCSWALEDQCKKRLYFAGDTAYKHVSSESPCPVFDQIGQVFGPFDLALLPIGLYSPVELLSSVHCHPEQTLELHKAIKSKKSIGMHYGTVRGGISAQYEDVREPPRRWQQCCEKEGMWETGECGLCDVGETVFV